MKVSIALGALCIAVVIAIFNNNQSYTVINQSSSASPAGVFAQAIRKALDAEWYQSSDCNDASNKFNNTENAIMIYNSSVAFAALNKNIKNCQLDQISKQKAKVILVSKSRMLVCKNANSTKDIAKDPVTLGMASMLAVKKHEEEWNANGGKVTIVPYSGSKTVARALLAEDIDYGLMGERIALQQGENLSCEYSTNPASDKFLGNSFNSLTIADFAINVVAYTNADSAEDIVQVLQVNPEFNKYLTNSRRTTDYGNSGDTGAVQKYVEKMFDTWSD